MKNQGLGSIKKRIVFAALIIGVILTILTSIFINGVQKQLWEQSINTILESTRQGCNTLKIQLYDEYEFMETAVKYLNELSAEQEDELEKVLDEYVNVDKGVGLYFTDGKCFPPALQKDENVEDLLQKINKDSGIIDPHINSVTGINVFNLFIKVVLKDGTVGYLVKEYEVDNIVDSFSLSFYNNSGFSYVINTQGDVLIRSPHPKSNKTVKNLFDMLPEEVNSADSLEHFVQALENSYSGWSVFTYQGEKTVFCYIPLKLRSDWFLISIIPMSVVNAQTNDILLKSFKLICSIILGIAILVICYIWYVNKTNKRLSNQAEYIEHLYNAVPDGIALITVNEPYRIIQLNNEGLKLLNYNEDIFNNETKDKKLKSIVHCDDLKKIIDILRNTVSSSRKNVFESRFIKSNGSFFWAAGIIEKTLDENGNPVLIAAFHDITDEKIAEEEKEREKLQEHITLVKALSNAYPVIISINLTKDTINFIFIKNGLMLDIGKEDSYSRLYNDIIPLIHTDDTDEFKKCFAPENVKNVLGQEKNEIFIEAKHMLSDGNYHWISNQIIYVDNPFSDDKLAILISRRTDEQHYEEEQRRQAIQSALDNAKAASEAKSRFLSNMSHDIRTPMNAIVGMTAIAAAHVDDHDRVIECLKKINFSSKHLINLINDVLDMSKIESGKMSLRNEPFNFAELVADSVELVYSQEDAKKLNLDVNLAILENENVISDPLRIRQIFVNILSNAVKYTPPGGNVIIEVKQESSLINGYQNYIFKCTDTGIGMEKEFLNNLFQPFERAQDTTVSKITGTGLGMAITKNVVDLLNGDIQVESNPGKGSSFTVTLPLQTQDISHENVSEEWVGVRSLIVDDDKFTCKNSAELLESMGLRVQFVTDGKSAVKTVIKEKDTPDPFQLIIVDWRLPDIDGIEVTRQIRNEVGDNIPIVILTAYDWSEIESEAKNAGVTAFLSKPFYRSKVCYMLDELSGRNEVEQGSADYSAADYSQKRVLLVEDNKINRDISRMLISEMGINVEEACDGEEAVEKIKESKTGYYDLILMDIQMPKLNGYEATKIIRSLNRSDVKNIPIIATTANAFEEDVHIALRAGMTAHLAKPIDVNAMKEMLYKYLILESSKNK